MLSETDEEYARRLQDEENGFAFAPLGGAGFERHNGGGHQRTPTTVAENPTLINARLNDLNSSRSTLCLLFSVQTPQIIAAMVVLMLHWNDPDVCDHTHTEQWKWWGALAALRMLSYELIILLMFLYKATLERNQEMNLKAINLRNMVDAFGLVWFVVGNMWLFGDDDTCNDPQKSPIYNMCVALLIINYIQICLPCILALLLVPIFCFCMPCLIRFLARMQDPRTVIGASDSILENLPETVLTAENIAAASSPSCPICLSDMVVGEVARSLRCNHLFHKECVDEWLRVNASCPTCRKRVVGDETEPNTSGGEGEGDGSGVQLITPGASSSSGIHIDTGGEDEELGGGGVSMGSTGPNRRSQYSFLPATSSPFNLSAQRHDRNSSS